MKRLVLTLMVAMATLLRCLRARASGVAVAQYPPRDNRDHQSTCPASRQAGTSPSPSATACPARLIVIHLPGCVDDRHLQLHDPAGERLDVRCQAEARPGTYQVCADLTGSGATVPAGITRPVRSARRVWPRSGHAARPAHRAGDRSGRWASPHRRQWALHAVDGCRRAAVGGRTPADRVAGASPPLHPRPRLIPPYAAAAALGRRCPQIRVECGDCIAARPTVTHRLPPGGRSGRWSACGRHRAPGHPTSRRSARGRQS